MTRWPIRRSSKWASQQGMTLIEIMMAVCIVAVLALIAIPAMQKARTSTQNARLIADMRVAVNAFEQVAFEPAGLPPDAAPGVVPDRMASYLTRMNWTGPTSIDGQWDWNPSIPAFGCGGVVVVLTDEQDTRMQSIDFQIDDGNLTTGLFQKVDTASYAFRVE